MTRNWILATLVAASLFALAAIPGPAQEPVKPPANPENIDAALKLTLAAAAEYEFRIGKDEKPLELRREPILRWSNPTEGEVHGNIFVWNRGGRPLVIGSLFKWFSPHTFMAHEFHSLAEEPLNAAFHGEPVWKTSEPGLEFAEIPNAPVPAASEAQRLLQLKQLAKEFSGIGTMNKDRNLELRLLPQPLHRYASPKQGIIIGGMFGLVRATDPEILLLIEARGQNVASARWHFAPARMRSTAELHLRHRNKPVWEAKHIPSKEIFIQHEKVYTTFRFPEIPGFLRDSLAKPKQ